MPASHSTASTAWRATATVSAYYALFGCFIPWLSRWMADIGGFTGEQIGLVITLSGLSRIVLGPLLSAWADGRSDRRTPIVVLGIVTLIAFSAMAAGLGLSVNFALVFLTQVTVWSLIAFLEAALIRLTGKDAGPAYGFARGLASAAFVVGNVAVGALVDQFGPWAILAWMIATTALMIVSGARMTPESQARVAGAPFGQRLSEGLSMLKRPEFALLAFGAGLIQGAHQYYYVFSTLLWRDQGFDGTTIGWLWALGVIAEVLFLMFLARYTERFSPALLILAGGVGSLLRWTGLAMEPGLAGLIPLQILHCASFAFTFLGTMRGIQLLYGDDRAPTAQMIYQSLANAPAAAGATYVAGLLYGAGMGAEGYLGMSAIAAVGTLFALLLVLRRGAPAPRLS